MITIRHLAELWGISVSCARRKLIRLAGPLNRLGYKVGNTWVFPRALLAQIGEAFDQTGDQK